MEKNVNAIYEYTSSILLSNDNSLNRLDTKFSAFIGFATIFIRVSLDLNAEYIFTKTLIGIFCSLAIAICVWGLFSQNKGKVGSPEELLSKKYINKENVYHQILICKQRINAIKDYNVFMEQQQTKINSALVLFITAIFIYCSALFNAEPVIVTILNHG